MKRKRVMACTIAATMAVVLAGNVMPVYAKSNLKNADDVVEIKMAVWTSGAADIYNKAAEGFNQTHDNIKLSVEMQSGDPPRSFLRKTQERTCFSAMPLPAPYSWEKGSLPFPQLGDIQDL